MNSNRNSFQTKTDIQNPQPGSLSRSNNPNKFHFHIKTFMHHPHPAVHKNKKITPNSSQAYFTTKNNYFINVISLGKITKR